MLPLLLRRQSTMTDKRRRGDSIHIGSRCANRKVLDLLKGLSGIKEGSDRAKESFEKAPAY